MKLYRVGFWIYRCIFTPEYKPIETKLSAAKLPWLFVGVELKDGTILDKTEKAQYLVNKGLPITPDTIDSFDIKRCFYLDAVTLKEIEIPAEGITINDS